ncbi:Thioredoxin-like fold containing protein [Trema orientale]|uniref:Thioredoxin-like fold containing protein n=1 Tax=Trema orientale TaxID=63057 RepID=A0A2P5ECF5_TREOI|nr:Thioredoxin-like fold containing protein [Trema orientale]
MGCSASRPIAILTKNPEKASSNPSASASESSISSSPVPRALSLATPLVHHPPLRKGDTHHLVSLTSTTYGYGSLLTDRTGTTPATTPTLNQNDTRRPKPKTTSSKAQKRVSSNPKQEEEKESVSPDSVINTWELMDGLDDNFDFSSANLDRPIGFRARPSSCRYTDFDGSAKKRVNSFESSRYSETIHEDSSSSSTATTTSSTSITKPLWQHLSEESLLSKMDPNVGLTYRRALSSRQLGDKHSKTRSLGSSPFSSFSSNTWFRLPGAEDKIVIYFTSLRGIRKTYEDCCSVRMIFRGFRVPVDERDISMDSEFKNELQRALGGGKALTLPQVFIRGKYIGGSDEVKQLHEYGELGLLLNGFPTLEPGTLVCNGCGGVRFLPCPSCNGSRKVFEEDQGELRRCSDCNENGLIRCPGCCS